MKKKLFSLFTLLFVGVSFCGAFSQDGYNYTINCGENNNAGSIMVPCDQEGLDVNILISGNNCTFCFGNENYGLNYEYLDNNIYLGGGSTEPDSGLICISNNHLHISDTYGGSCSEFGLVYNSINLNNVIDQSVCMGYLEQVQNNMPYYCGQMGYMSGGQAQQECMNYIESEGLIDWDQCDSEYSGYILPEECPSCPSCPTCPDQYSSLECQSEYSLIPISSVDSNYCTTNGLCSSSGGGDCLTGDISWSALYINDIQHLGKPIINITIPEELDRDYTNNTGSFDLDIVGYNVDYDYINDIVSVQNYKPTQEDFNNIIGSFGSFGSLLIGALFIILLFYFIKKIFK